MSSSILSIIFILLLLVFNPSTLAIATEENIDPGTVTCNMLAALEPQNYTVDIGPNISSASFAINWRNEASKIKMDIQTPTGEWIRPDRDSFVATKDSNTSRTYSIEMPAAGRWVIKISPGNQQTVHEDYCISAHLVNMKSADQYAARFSGLFSDNAKDEDNDGSDDHITIGASVSVKAAGKYSATGVLANVQNGEKIRINNAAFLNIGSHKIQFDLFDLKSPGPYSIESLSLYDENGKEIDKFVGNYITKTYRTNYDNSTPPGPRAKLTGIYSDYGSDINNDGLFEYLTVDVGVMVYDPGNYSVMGYLYDENGKKVVWSLGSAILPIGPNTLHMDFDGKTIELHKFNGTYHLKELQLVRGDSAIENLSMVDTIMDATATLPYDYKEFVDPVWPEKILSGNGKGEILLTIQVSSILPVFHGRYSMDIVGASMPPISSNWTVTGTKNGYSYDLPGIYMPNKPNNFTVKASNVKNLNVGVKKDPVEGRANITRTWISTRANADKDGIARIDNDMISPGRYQFKIFGDAIDNATQVALEMKVVKKLIINGRFDLALNTSGFPTSNYSINAKAINESVRFDEINLNGPSSGF
jgi:hypothetical protein